jgi:hypothetical protein
MDVSKSFEVVAEVVPSRPGSMCSVASSEANDVVAAEPDQQAPFEVLNARLSTSSSAALLVSIRDGVGGWNRWQSAETCYGTPKLCNRGGCLA